MNSPPTNVGMLRRRRRRRWFVVLFLALFGAAYVAWSCLYLPPELQQLQGVWRVTNMVDEHGVDIGPFAAPWVFQGRHHYVLGAGLDGYVPMDLGARPKELVFFSSASNVKFMGLDFRLPAWLPRARVELARCTYDLDGDRLELWIPVTGTDKSRKFTLKRGAE